MERRFNPRSRKGNDMYQKQIKQQMIGFQSTFPQGERHINEVVQTSASQVSIHVPARGTTRAVDHYLEGSDVSIHVPARGTTVVVLNKSIRSQGFNPRSRKGNDDVYSVLNPALAKFQSTFPQGERRSDYPRRMHSAESFNPRSRKGNDEYRWKRHYSFRQFQSTFPQGERQNDFLLYKILLMFQSTFPQGERRWKR